MWGWKSEWKETVAEITAMVIKVPCFHKFYQNPWAWEYILRVPHKVCTKCGVLKPKLGFIGNLLQIFRLKTIILKHIDRQRQTGVHPFRPGLATSEPWMVQLGSRPRLTVLFSVELSIQALCFGKWSDSFGRPWPGLAVTSISFGLF